MLYRLRPQRGLKCYKDGAPNGAWNAIKIAPPTGLGSLFILFSSIRDNPLEPCHWSSAVSAPAVDRHFPLGNFKIPQGSRHDKKGDFKIHQGNRLRHMGRGRFPLGDLCFPLGKESRSYAFLPAPQGVLRFPLGKSVRHQGDFPVRSVKPADCSGKHHNSTRLRRNDTIPRRSPRTF